MIKIIGITFDSLFSNAITPRNQHIAKTGWKNIVNLTERFKSAKS